MVLSQIDLSTTDLNLLVLFDAVFRERQVARAAKRLHISPSAVSHGLGRLRRLFNDPVFLRMPKGVVPTARASELAAPITQVLAGARNVLASVAPFDPRTTARDFAIGAPDGVTSLFLLPLLTRLRRETSRISVRLRQLLPPEGRLTGEEAWEPLLAELDAGRLDLAIAPFGAVPARFSATSLAAEEFVVVARRGHRFARTPRLETYCAADHVVVSHTGDGPGFVDRKLAEMGLVRRVAVTVPGFFMALSLVAEGGLLATVPRSFARAHAARLGVVVRRAPVPLPRFGIKMVAARAALDDAALAWLHAAIRRLVDEAAPLARGGARPGSAVRGARGLTQPRRAGEAGESRRPTG